jgi:FkbM family methyltransferase
LPAPPSRVTTTSAASGPLGRALRSVAFWKPLARLTPDRLSRLRFWLVAAELTVRHKLGRRARRSRPVRLISHDLTVAFAIRDIGELHGLREVYVQGDYALSLPADPRVVLDLGGNIGAAAVYFATRWPDAEVVVVEPDPDAFGRLVRNTRRFARVRTLRLAVADADGEAKLYGSGYSLTSSLVPGPGDRQSIPVPTATLDTLVDRHCGGRVDLVKFDIEGLEHAVLRACRRRDRIPALVGEVHEGSMGASLAEFAGLFPGHRVEIDPLPNGEHAFRAWR